MRRPRMPKVIVEEIMAYESGEMPAEKTLDFFAKLIKTKLCWSLQGCYGRTADNLIKQGYIDEKGKILRRS